MPVYKSSKVVQSTWKDTQSKTKMKQKTVLAMGVLMLLGGIILFSWVVRFTQGLFSPVSEVKVERNYLWSEEFNINLLIRSGQTFMLTYSPKQEKVFIVEIPENVFVEVPQGFGKWQLRSVYGLGGNRLLKDSLTNFLAVPLDGYLDLTSLKSPLSAEQLVESFRSNFFSGFNLLGDIKTDLTRWELMRLKLSIGGIRFDKVQKIDLEKSGVLEREKLADGTEVLTADPVRLDSVLTEFADPAVLGEHKSIAVLNAADQPQFAKKWARLISNLGGNVIIMSNAESRLEKTQISGEESLTLKRLRQIFGLSGKIMPSEAETSSSRSQINVLLGEDYINK